MDNIVWLMNTVVYLVSDAIVYLINHMISQAEITIIKAVMSHNTAPQTEKFTPFVYTE